MTFRAALDAAKGFQQAKLELWDVRSQELRRTWRVFGVNGVDYTDFSPTKKLLAVAAAENEIDLWRLE